MSVDKGIGNGTDGPAQTLQAIVYSRTSLKLLDQRKLPLESIYLDIPDANAGWNAIQDMVVRGAPAIAIAAALSLAVDVVKHETFADADTAVKYINERLDYLVTSRPTAVNLADAAGKLKIVVAKAFGKTPTVEHVVDAYVSASEAMLAQDEADNRAIGSFGADFVFQNRGDSSGGLQVLTHCNTGSLATAAYGTALGVVRALFEQGKLDKAFCTETRPYNQGARLTAYELVYEKIPATLIADSAAASLLAGGQIGAIIVGADRIASNGDTANKIGTYSLAVNAKHHGVPFYVAAPLTSIDLAMPSGKGIVIEERTPRELTHALGGQGPQVAPSGIGVWNPAFDVTPADIISAIFTDKGVITKAPGLNAFDIPAFIAQASAGQEPAAAPKGGEAGAASVVAPVAGFRILDDAGCRAYLEENKVLADRLGGSKEEWEVKEVGDGNLNFVYIVKGPAGSLVLKQSVPYVRCVGPSWPMTVERSFFEVSALKEHHRFSPEHVPEVYHQDRDLAVFAMRYLEPPHIILRKGLISGVTYPRLADDVADYMASTLFSTSLLALDSTEFKAGVAKFCGNVEMCRLTEQVIFTEPYCKAENNHWTTPQLDADVEALREDAELKCHVAGLKAKFVGLNQALIHGDLHTGSLMVTETSTQVIDPEFAFYGPMGFDVGAYLANLWLAYFSQEGHRSPEDDRVKYRAWIADTAEKTWTLFVDKFLALWKKSAATKPGDAYPPAVYNSPTALEAAHTEYVAALFQDTLGFAAAKMIRRIVGIAHVEDLESVGDADLRATCERKALNFGKQLMKARGSLSTIRDVTALLNGDTS